MVPTFQVYLAQLGAWRAHAWRFLVPHTSVCKHGNGILACCKQNVSYYENVRSMLQIPSNMGTKGGDGTFEK
jgi:hypothetical protein